MSGEEQHKSALYQFGKSWAIGKDIELTGEKNHRLDCIKDAADMFGSLSRSEMCIVCEGFTEGEMWVLSPGEYSYHYSSGNENELFSLAR